jgi:glycosyltransferase involved in cell wall biosynthesis
MMDVSVIIPTRNRTQFLQRALASVRKQQYPGSFECIVIDDGDAAFSGQVRALVDQSGGIYLSTGGNRGGGSARNLGIERAQGELVAFLDDDDTWEETKLARQTGRMADASIAMSYTGMYIIGRNGRRRYSFRKPRFDDQYREIMRHNFIGTTSTVMVRRSALHEIGGFDPLLPALQDYDLYIRLLRRFRTGWVDAPLTSYYADAASDKISASRERFYAATKLMSGKYRDDPRFPSLRKSFRSITLLKCVRSRRFLVDSILALGRR